MTVLLSSGDCELNCESRLSAPCLVASAELERRLDWSYRYSLNAEKIDLPDYAIHLHVFYLDTLPDILIALSRVCLGANLLLTTDQGNKANHCYSLLKDLGLTALFSSVTVLVVPNAGRNVWALLGAAYQELSAYPLVLHLHTKKSPHSSLGGDWMVDLMQCLLGTKARLHGLRTAFAVDPGLGVVLPRTFEAVRPHVNWGGNYAIAQSCCRQAFPGRTLEITSPLIFPAGMMFWFRPLALNGLRQMPTLLGPPPPEPLPHDGTLLHAIERLVLHACENEGYSWAFCGNDQNRIDNHDVSIPKGKALVGGVDVSVWRSETDNYLRAATLVIHGLHESHKKLQRIESSFAWRCAAPLRFVRRFVKSLRSEPSAGT